MRPVTARFIAPLCCAAAVLAISPAGSSAAGPRAAAAELGVAPVGQSLQLVLPLKVDGTALQRFALAVSTPGSPSYRQYQPIATLARRFGASPAARQRVVAYLRRMGAAGVRIDATGLFADATMSARVAERVFATKLAQFRTAGVARFTAPASAVSIPPALHGLITGVVGLNTRPLASPPAQSASPPAQTASPPAQTASTPAQTASPAAGIHTDGAPGLAAQPTPETGSAYSPSSGTHTGCAAAQATGGFTPNQYLTAYQYDPLHLAGTTGQGERVALIEVDGYKLSDINAFARCFGLHVPTVNSFPVGVRRAPAPGGESTLDIELLDAAAPGLKAIDVYESSAAASSTLKALTAPLQNSNQEPEVISASLGLCERYTDAAVGRAAIHATELALAEATASGITFLASSGDSGSADCTQNGTPVDRLAVNYPASSWWVTGVGGTNLVLDSNNAIESEPVWNDAFAVPGSAGGGGLSMLFPRPSYQNGTVSANARAVPDVSMLADVSPGYAVYCSATRDCINSSHANPWQTVGGTSAATPLLAGGFALVDETLRLHGRQELGLANPLLYKLGRNGALTHQVFFDVTQLGNDVGPYITASGQPLGCCSATAGYDEASGWGSVNLASFSAAALAMQPKIVNLWLSLPREQNPIHNREIFAKVFCSGPCLFGATATITIGHSQSPKLNSSVYHLRSRGLRTISIKLPGGEVNRLRAGLAHHSRMVAAVVGAVLDTGGNVEKQSRVRLLAISS